MQTNKKSEINRHLARPAEKKPMNILDYINRINSIYGNGTDKKTSTDQRTDSKQVKPDTKVIAKIEKKPKKEKWTYQSWADGLEERTRPKKKIIKIVKKILVADKKSQNDAEEIKKLLDLIDPSWYLDDDGNPIEPKPTTKEESKTRAIRTGITKLI